MTERQWPDSFDFQGFNEPIGEEWSAQDLEVEGSIPGEIEGAFLRAGADPQFAPFVEHDTYLSGDGMVSRFRIRNGKADFAIAGGSGEHPAVAVQSHDPSPRVIYRPADLGAVASRSLGVLLWGNGGCTANGLSASRHLLEIASHGYVAIAPGTMNYRADRRGLDAEGSFPPVETVPRDLLDALDWVLAENLREGSELFGKIDPAAIAVAGHSCGGLQAIQAAADARVAAAIVHNSGILNPGADNPITGFEFGKADLNGLHTPVLYLLGGPSDIAHPNGRDDFERIDHVPTAIAEIDVGHGGTFDEANGGAAAKIALAWLDWHLKGRFTAARMFAGSGCGLCTSDNWSFERKRLPVNP